MKITVIHMGETAGGYLREGLALYEGRIRHYAPFELIYLPEPKMKSRTEKIQKENEGKTILSSLSACDHKILLDERGRQLTSPAFAAYIQQVMNRGTKNLGFVIGGPFGFSDEVYARVPEMISLSSMTFSHQMVRLLFLEQLYRAFTIIRGEPYHHG
jgi:23S rRNA (pseudouridine1915-N3)-methyltransferase